MGGSVWMAVAGLVCLLAGCIEGTPAAEEPVPSPPPETPTTVSACQAVGRAPASGGGQGVTNQPGSFTYSDSPSAKVATETYLWQNTANAAQLAWSGSSGTGTLTLAIEDACGKEVYKKNVSGPSTQSASEMSSPGTPGEWYLTFEFTVYTGSISLAISSS